MTFNRTIIRASPFWKCSSNYNVCRILNKR